ncbi:hypothetical protein [Sulfitobacter sp.]|uniref:hypothetical protein n=1 Tax=Sulfitobacter sp. TaxID=1903071 RepID=UPI003EF45544
MRGGFNRTNRPDALALLRTEAFIAFAAAPRGSQEQRNAFAAMRAIEDVLTSRALRP